MRLALVLILASAAIFRANGQRASLASFRNVNATDIASSVAPISSTLGPNSLACMYMCAVNSNCVLAVFKFANKNCMFYNSSALTRAITSTDSIVYQKPING
jgi:hypothetical protein